MHRYLAAMLVVAVAVVGGVVGANSRATANGSKEKRGGSSHRLVKGLTGLPANDATVYKLLVNIPMDDGQTGQRTEWISRPSGSWRIEGDTPKLYVNGQYYVVDTEMGSSARSGSGIFMGNIPFYSAAAAALEAYTTGTMAQHGVTASQTSGGVQLQWPARNRTVTGTIQQTLAASSAQAQSLFAVPGSTITATDTEVPVGTAPTNGTQGYWFGSTISGRSAVLAVQRSSYSVPGYITASNPTWAENVHFTYYELPADASHTSATPGMSSAPEGEIQVASQARATTNGRQTVNALLNGVNGDQTYAPWPQQAIMLASGEQATLVINKADGPSVGSDGQTRWTEFWVMTGTTLVSVDGWFTESEINALAPQLRRL